jgi:putative spermidine/putrescine transport system substrate-binding protein/spermidine/putrescine transport system substrate-binding protein
MTEQAGVTFNRRRFLQLTGALGVSVAAGGVLGACSTAGGSAAPAASASAAAASTAASAAPSAAPTGTFNWMTWGDHWIQSQLDTIANNVNISANISELSGNAEGYAKLKEVKGQLDKVSADAMWVPNAYFKDGLIEPFDITSLKVSSQLYSFAREFPYWQAPGGGYMAYPFGWSPILIFYDPAKVSGNPTDWQVLLDPKYKGRVVVEHQPEEIVAYMARAAGFDKPYDLTDDQLSTVKGYLEKLKPNILKFAQQATDSVAAMVSGEAWLITGNLGNEDRVKDGGGPEIKGYVPNEGTVGWHDGEMIVKEGSNKALILPFLEQSQQAELIAENFLVNGRPLFNEKAYQLLTDQGKKDQADRYLYSKAPEVLPKVVLKGPGTSTEKSIQLFNEVFGGG